MKILLLLGLILGAFLLVVFIDISAGLFNFFCNHKCPFCGKRTKYLYKKTMSDGEDYYVFNCPHCHSEDCVSTTEMLNNYYGIK